MISEAFFCSLMASASAPLSASLVARSCCCSGEKRGWVAVMTSTSSSRSRCAAGFTITSMNESRSGSRTTFSTTPTGSPRGKIWSPPAVSTFSPGWMRWSARMPTICGWPAALPRRMPRIRVVSRITPAPLVWSLMASTCAECGKDVAHLAHDSVRR